MSFSIKAFTAALALSLLLPLSPANAKEDVWPTLKQETFGDRAIESDGMIVLEIPDTAEDASLVPLTVRVPPVHGP